MHTVQGRVLGRATGRGIPHLVVECFDVDASTDVAELRKPNRKSSRRPRRAGSATTDDQGFFRLAFPAATAVGKQAATRNGKGPNLVLTVSAPEGAESSDAPLHVSPGIRFNAGATESYVVHVPEEAVRRAGLPAPGTPAGDAEPVEEVAKRLLESAKRDVAIAKAVQVAEKVKFDAAADVASAFDRDFRPALETRLTAVTPALAASDTYVASDAALIGVHRNVIETDLRTVINDPTKRSPVKSLIALTDEQRTALSVALDADGSIAEDDLARIVADKPTSTEYLRTDPLAALCRELTDDEVHCADALDIRVPEDHDHEPGGSGVPEAGAGVEVIETGDVPRYLARLVDTLTSPEEGVVAGLEPRSNQSSVASSMQQLAFRPSPADTTAVYQFHNLQVAFRHVWQEAVDEGVLTLAQAAYDEIVMAGGAPRVTDGVDPVRALVASANAVVRARAAARTAAGGTQKSAAPSVLPKLAGIVGSVSGMVDGLLAGSAQLPTVEPVEPLPSLLAELQQRLQEPYAFTTFGANRKERSVNFGTLITYEQEWQPLAYQAGKLAKTITLAPKEVRKFTKTVKRHRKRAEKEVETHLSIVKQETSQTSRAEQEIIRKANAKTNFQFSAESTAKDPTGMAEGTTKTAFEREASQVSESVKKAFHESVVKAAQEFKDEVSLEVTTEEGESFEETESGEILNPNDELAVTFLFYELQRRYRVNERLHRITPVVLVAQEMPKPHEINEAWLVSHDWILRRVLLDDSFAPALTYLSTRVVGDQVALAEMRTNIGQQRAIITELKQQLTIVRARTATYRNLLEKQMLNTAQERSGGGGGGGLFGAIPIVGDAIELAEDAVQAVGNFINPDMPEVGDSRQDTLKETIQRSVDEERDLLMRLEREVTALNALTESYAKALAENFNQRTQILRLRTHVKQNITYYMQAIWNHEPPDQRYLRLHETPVPTFTGRRRFVFPDVLPRPDAMVAMAHKTLPLPGVQPARILECRIVPDFTRGDTKPLAQVADLDTLLGYFGNYMIFRLKTSNPLTDFMMQPYIVRGFDELTDPDDLANWSLDEFVKYVCCLRDRLTDEEFERVKPALKEQYERLIQAPRRNGDVITIPTGSLFIEALPATASLMERFKATHRMVDVKKAQAEARQAEIRNLWMVDRLLHGEREDPDIDKKVIIEGAAGPVLPLDDPT